MVEYLIASRTIDEALMHINDRKMNVSAHLHDGKSNRDHSFALKEEDDEGEGDDKSVQEEALLHLERLVK